MIRPIGFFVFMEAVLFTATMAVLFIGVADAIPPQKIVGSTMAALGEFPYMVLLKYNSYHFCGGAIVGPRHIVTSARCLDSIGPDMFPTLHVVTGSVYSNGGTDYVFSKIIRHPDYDSESTDSAHDIGIIKLAVDIPFDQNQASIELPTEIVPEGVLVSVIGWGYPHVDAQSKVVPSELMKINMKIHRADSCNNDFVGVNNIQNSQVCTFGGNGVGSWMTGGGGVIAYKGQLVGIVSHGMDCAKGYLDVYTSVYHHVDWIKKTVKE